MKIKFYGRHNVDDSIENIVSILSLFKQRYGINSFVDLKLDLTLCDEQGQEVELVDAATSEILGTFEVYQSGELRERYTAQNDKKPTPIRLVVDNTK